jgi:methylthioribose-1-phosphate isomerase
MRQSLAAVPMPTIISASVLLDDSGVRILDRRVFPGRIEYVWCRSHGDVATAIVDMVTQSGGPFFAAGAGFVLAAREAEAMSSDHRLPFLTRAAEQLIATRPTNNGIRDVVGHLVRRVQPLLHLDGLGAAVETLVRETWDDQHAKNRALGAYASTMVEDGDAILTHCWAESCLVEMLVSARSAGKKVSVLCTETRPYLQGARLTAHSVAEMGIDVTVITDNMAAHAMDQGRVSKLMTGADRVTLSGHVINKVGTHQLAITAHAFGIPFTAMVRSPDVKALSPADVEMEERDPEETLHCLGARTASPLAQGWYPAFDITPPGYVSAVATSRGVFSPHFLRQFYAGRDTALTT